MLLKRLLCMLLLTASLLSTSSSRPVFSEERKSTSKSTIRVLSFPNDFPVGKIYLLPADWKPDSLAPEQRPIEARGKVMIRGDRPLMLDLSQDAAMRPKQLANIPTKDFVYLRLQNVQVDDTFIKVIDQFQSLSRLELKRLYITDQGLTLLGPMENLQTLICEFCSVRGPGLASLVKFKKLHQLCVSYGSTESNQLAPLFKLQSVRDLKMRSAKLNDTSLADIGKMTFLERLDLKGNPRISNAGMKYLIHLKHLVYLNLDKSQVTAAGFMLLKDLPLRNVAFSSEQVSPEDLKRLQKAFPKITFEVRKVDNSDYIKLFAPLK